MRLPLVLGGILATVAGAYAYSGRNSATVEASGRFTCTVAAITDGDTLRCSERDASGRQVRVRLAYRHGGGLPDQRFNNPAQWRSMRGVSF